MPSCRGNSECFSCLHIIAFRSGLNGGRGRDRKRTTDPDSDTDADPDPENKPSSLHYLLLTHLCPAQGTEVHSKQSCHAGCVDLY
jgi:hypothetical protein